MSDVTNTKPDGNMSMPAEERDIKITAKGLTYCVERYQAARKSKYKHASKLMKSLQMLMESKENVTDVQN